MTERINPKNCTHPVTSRVSGTRDLWKCFKCQGLLQDNVTLVTADGVDTDELPIGKGGLVQRLRAGKIT